MISSHGTKIEDSFEYKGYTVEYTTDGNLYINGEDYTAKLAGKFYSRSMVSEYIETHLVGPTPLSDYVDKS